MYLLSEDVSKQEMDTVSVLCVPCCLGRVTGRWLSGSIMPFKMKPHADTLCKLPESFPLAGKLKVSGLQTAI